MEHIMWSYDFALLSVSISFRELVEEVFLHSFFHNKGVSCRNLSVLLCGALRIVFKGC